MIASSPGQVLSAEEAPRQGAHGVTARSILLALPLVAANAWWLMANWGTAGYASSQSFATIISLYYNVVFSLLLVMAANSILKRRSPQLALTQTELLTVYVMLAVGSSVAGHDWLQITWPTTTYAAWFANPSNRWGEFLKFIPNWLTIPDRDRLADFYRGASTLYTWEHIRLWLPLVMVWSAFMVVLTAVMLLLVLLVKERWIRHERLTYPVVQMPVAMSEATGTFFRDRLMWTGLLLAAGMDLVNGLHALYPQVPGVGGSLWDVGYLFRSRPFSAINGLAVAVYPFAVGMSFLIPLDLSFSIWFFYLFGKGTRIVGEMAGTTSDPRFPYIAEQSAGAWIGLAIVVVWAGRSYLASRVREALRTGARSPNEPLSTRWTLIALAVGTLLLTAFCALAGVPVWLALLYLLLFFAISLAITRARAEVGPPAHDVPAHPPLVLVSFLGTERVGMPGLTLFTLLNSFNRFYRCHPMPTLLEGFAALSRGRGGTRRLAVAMMLAAIVGTLASAWAYYALGYRHGAAIFGEHGQCRADFDQLASWQNNPTGANGPAIIAILSGSAFTFALMALRRSFFWWPFHPAGYALSLSFCNTSWYWSSIAIGWFLKLVIMRAGGFGATRRATAFFMGMVLGEFVMGSVWSLLGIALGVPMYRFLF